MDEGIVARIDAGMQTAGAAAGPEDHDVAGPGRALGPGIPGPRLVHGHARDLEAVLAVGPPDDVYKRRALNTMQDVMHEFGQRMRGTSPDASWYVKAVSYTHLLSLLREQEYVLDSPAARTCALWFPSVMLEAVSYGPWSFATKESVLEMCIRDRIREKVAVMALETKGLKLVSLALLHTLSEQCAIKTCRSDSARSPHPRWSP